MITTTTDQPHTTGEFRLDPFEPPPFPVRRWTVAEYRQLAEQGFLTEADQVELLEGWIVPKMTKNPRHEVSLQGLIPLLTGLVPTGWHLRMQSPLDTRSSEPDPDAFIVRGLSTDYEERLPGRGDVGLVIEVADSSLSRDRRKAAIYAEIGIPAYWIINLREGCIEVFEQPDESSRSYQSLRVITGRESIPVVLDGQPAGELSISQLIHSRT